VDLDGKIASWEYLAEQFHPKSKYPSVFRLKGAEELPVWVHKINPSQWLALVIIVGFKLSL